jgi:PKD repeat protein
VTQDVAADYLPSVTTGVAPLTVAFEDLSGGSPTSWSWDFGDGGTSTEQNPSHNYQTAGTYSVMLVATGTCGPDTMIQTDLIVVDLPPAPVAAFSGDLISGCLPLEIAFTDESSGDITAWAWDFGDGGTDTAPHPTYTYITAGTFTVSLTVTGPGGSDTLTLTDYVTVAEPVVASFAVSDTTGLAPLEIDFTDQSTGDVTFWRWDFGDATTDTVQHPTHTYTEMGDFTVTLITGNSCSQDTLVLVEKVHVVGITGVDPAVVNRFVLGQNVPNPFNPITTIHFELPTATRVRLQVYDISGRLVRTLLNGESLGAGRQEVIWYGKNDSGRQVAAGVYFYHLNAGSFQDTKRMTLVK